jgi:uncharacterized Rmd1/YagE family protein
VVKATSSSFLRCVAFCTASGYDLSALANSYKRKGYIVHQSRDVVHVFNIKQAADIFFFSHGSFVTWGFKKPKEEKLLERVKEFEISPNILIQRDHFCFRLGEDVTISSHERFKVDVITLDSNNQQIKLAISYGLAQSIKLESFEDAIQETIKKNASLPEAIARKGIVSLSRSALFKRIGEIFIARSSINLSSEYLDTPEFFWRNPNLEPFYIMTVKFLDIPSRVNVLNQKLDVLQKLLDILNSQVQHRHSSFLEMIIILLITIEILISLYHWW